MIHRVLRRWAHGYWRMCGHRSHRLGLRCYRFLTYDGYCARHNTICWQTCEPHDVTYVPRSQLARLLAEPQEAPAIRALAEARRAFEDGEETRQREWFASLQSDAD